MAGEWKRCSKHSKGLHLRVDDTIRYKCCCGKCQNIQVLKLDRSKPYTEIVCPKGSQHRIKMLDPEAGTLMVEKYQAI